MSGRELTRAALLLEQGRYELAEKELRGHLAEQPDDPLVHSLLALCLSHRKRHAEAEQEARQAVALAPDLALPYYHLAIVLDQREALEEAASAVREAIRLEPEDADYHARLAAIRIQQSRWTEALAAAGKALELDPEHSLATNLRALILMQTGRTDQAHETIDAALARDPEDALSHANRGWTLLRQGRHREALGHFREALRLDPETGFAREGIVEAMKARNPLYRPLLRVFLWMGGLEGKAQIGLVLGLFIGSRVLRGLARTRPELAPFIIPLLLVYAGFVLLTWIAEPLFNLLLRLDRFGRHALSREQIVASNWLGAALALGLAALAAGLATRSQTAFLIAVAAAGLALPLVATFRRDPGWPRRILGGYTLLLGLVLAVLIFSFWRTDSEQASSLAGATVVLAILGGILSTWISLALSALRLRR